jgi:hypothetical protein
VHAVEGIAPGLVDDAREHERHRFMGRRGILDRQHHVDLVAFDRAGIPIDDLPLVASRCDDTLRYEANRSALEGTLQDGATLAEKSGATGDRPAHEGRVNVSSNVGPQS